MNNQPSNQKSKIVFYDGFCHLCSASVQILNKMDRKKVLKYMPLQSALAEQLLYPLKDKPDSIILYSGGHIFTKMDAVIETGRIAGGIFYALFVFKLLPLSWRNKLYDFIAANRYSWFGKKDRCDIPSDGIDL
jgi:predicted DCC family thiol-disulfide oxidoreductase YuxK